MERRGKDFSEQTKREVIEQLPRCMNCGGGHITFHHGRPKVMGGDGRRENCIPLCRGKGTNECHTKADNLTIRYGISINEIAKEGIAPLLEGIIYERRPNTFKSRTKPRHRFGGKKRRR